MDELYNPNSAFKQLLATLEFEQTGHDHWRCTTVPGFVLYITVQLSQLDSEPCECYQPFLIRRADGVSRYPENGFYTFEGAVAWLVDYLLRLGVR